MLVGEKPLKGLVIGADDDGGADGIMPSMEERLNETKAQTDGRLGFLFFFSFFVRPGVAGCDTLWEYGLA